MESICVAVNAEEADRVAGMLWLAGVCGIEERVEGERQMLIASFETSERPAVLAALKGSEHTAPEEVSSEPFRDVWREWARSVQVFDDIVVSPTWVEPSATPDQRVLWLEPGQAWGHGAHPTTLLCATELAGMALGQQRVLDVGCGSGALSLVAAHRGAAVVALDLDPEALRVTAANAEVNGYGDAIAVDPGELNAAEHSADVVVANIGLAAFRDLAPILEQSAAPTGRLILSGVLEAQVEATLELFVASTLLERRDLDGWSMLHLEVKHEP